MAEVDATRACVVCGTLFARYKTKSVCSDACAATRQREYRSRSDARKPAIVKQCKWCAAEFTPRNSAVCCCAEHARLLKLKRDRDRDVAPEQRAAWNAKYVAGNRAAVRDRDNAYKARVRSERGRGDRSAEYGRTKIRRRKPKSQWLIGNRRLQSLTPDRIIGRILGMAPLKTHRAARLIAKADDHIAHMGSAERWRWKYHNDAAFREAQLQSIKASKLRRKKKTEFCMTRAQVLAVYAERSSCLYCGVRLERGEKVLDHMDPLSKGGAHDASNLVVACAKCNTRKSAKLFVDWLPHVTESRRAMVAKVYAKKHGALAEHGGLMLAMKAA